LARVVTSQVGPLLLLLLLLLLLKMMILLKKMILVSVLMGAFDVLLRRMLLIPMIPAAVTMISAVAEIELVVLLDRLVDPAAPLATTQCSQKTPCPQSGSAMVAFEVKCKGSAVSIGTAHQKFPQNAKSTPVHVFR
jgi:hypothetical protein